MATQLAFMCLALALLGWGAMQTSIGPAPSHRRKSQYDDICKLARLYLKQAPNSDPAMEEWVAAQRQLLIDIAWAPPQAFEVKASSKVSGSQVRDNSAR